MAETESLEMSRICLWGGGPTLLYSNTTVSFLLLFLPGQLSSKHRNLLHPLCEYFPLFLACSATLRFVDVIPTFMNRTKRWRIKGTATGIVLYPQVSLRFYCLFP